MPSMSAAVYGNGVVGLRPGPHGSLSSTSPHRDVLLLTYLHTVFDTYLYCRVCLSSTGRPHYHRQTGMYACCHHRLHLGGAWEVNVCGLEGGGGRNMVPAMQVTPGSGRGCDCNSGPHLPHSYHLYRCGPHFILGRLVLRVRPRSCRRYA